MSLARQKYAQENYDSERPSIFLFEQEDKNPLSSIMSLARQKSAQETYDSRRDKGKCSKELHIFLKDIALNLLSRTNFSQSIPKVSQMLLFYQVFQQFIF